MKNKIHAALILFVREYDDPMRHNKVLLGLKKNGATTDWVMPPGGHVELNESPKDAAIREGFEEVSLKANGKYTNLVARLRIKIRDTKKQVVVDVFKCTRWTNKLDVKDPNLENVRFYETEKIPYDQIPTGEKEWMRAVLRGRYCKVVIYCGKNRKDVISVTTRDTPTRFV